MKRNYVLWTFLIALILVIFFFNQLLAIWFTLLLLCIAVIFYVFSLTSKKKLLRTLQKYNRIPDTDIAEELNYPIEKIRKKLSKLHKHQKNRSGLVVLLNNRYIFFSKEAINEFKRLYNKGLKQKEILENLKTSMGLKTRAEVKAIEDTLIDHKKLEKKDVIVQIKD